MFRINRDLCCFSTSGKYFATAHQQELIVRDCRTLESVQTFSFQDVIEYLDWSPGGQLILCANIKKGVIQVYSIKHPKWKCKLTQGSCGMERAFWGPDDRSILSISDLNIHLSIWTLDDHNLTNIWSLKSSAPQSIALNIPQRQLSVIVSKKGRDWIEIYETNTWKLTRKLMCDKLFGIDGVCWSPNGELLAIWCSTIENSRLLVYSSVTDSHIGAFSGGDREKNGPTNGITKSLQEKNIKGIDKVVWSPEGQLLAIVGYNEMIVVVNYVTWTAIVSLYCDPVIREGNYLGKVFKEIEVKRRDWAAHIDSLSLPDHHIKHKMQEINERPINIEIDIKPINWNVTIAAIDTIEFSPCGRFLAIRHQLYPATVWIWDLMDDCVDYLLLKNSVSGISWEPIKTRLLVSSESSLIFEWRPRKPATSFESPKAMKVLNFKWNPQGEIVALQGYNKTSVIRIGD
ncbi:WD repeat-containing protein WRAP73 [Fopius arisanus]|uniref:WD repeat-containing protein WRAP73 n=1 Tax=Fopius arisanus TaxID=64838 RepID=A0A9R1SVY9_9HYME|nr:PREDICTED: WD repeat-containing protein WRAP73-like [Fopius arisanus]